MQTDSTQAAHELGDASFYLHDYHFRQDNHNGICTLQPQNRQGYGNIYQVQPTAIKNSSLQRKQSMRLCGIMHRSIILRLKVLRNQSLIFTKAKKQRKKNIDYSKKSESVCNLKSLFIKKGRVILIICPVLYIMALYDTRDKRYFVKQFPQFLLYDAAINIFCRR